MYYIELDETNQFTAYCENKSQVAPEHATFVIQITDALYQLLLKKMPWTIATPDFTKVYDIPDIDLFVEIIPIQTPSLQDQINDNAAAISMLMGV